MLRCAAGGCNTEGCHLGIGVLAAGIGQSKCDVLCVNSGEISGDESGQLIGVLVEEVLVLIRANQLFAGVNDLPGVICTGLADENVKSAGAADSAVCGLNVTLLSEKGETAEE